MSDLLDKTPQNRLPVAVDPHNSEQVFAEDASPEHGEFEEPPQSTIQNKETTRNLESAFEEEDDEDDEPTPGDIFRMMRSMQRAQAQQAAQQHVLIDQHQTLKEEKKSIMKLISERILKPAGAAPENFQEDDTQEAQLVGRYTSLMRPRASATKRPTIRGQVYPIVVK
ncbi:hypothetical protein M5689_024948 [Euphorbia peplus]|nr:hypothetical protein M5689_024948 [Euphorbia peplus]